MGREMSVSDTVVIDGITPGAAYAEVSDVTQMGRWSPENLGAETDAPAEAAYVGMVFVGANKRGGFRWKTRCTVTEAEPGRRFAFRVHAFGTQVPWLRTRIATWGYTFEPVDGGTRVTETWTDDRRWPDVAAAAFDRRATGGHLFADFQRRNIARTLKRLKAELES